MGSFSMFMVVVSCFGMLGSDAGPTDAATKYQQQMTKQYMLRMQGMVNMQKMYLMAEKERLFWMQYQALMSMKFPLEHLKEENIENKIEIEKMKKENDELKHQMLATYKEVAIIKKETEILKKENSMQKWKKEKDKGAAKK